MKFFSQLQRCFHSTHNKLLAGVDHSLQRSAQQCLQLGWEVLVADVDEALIVWSYLLSSSIHSTKCQVGLNYSNCLILVELVVSS